MAGCRSTAARPATGCSTATSRTSSSWTSAACSRDSSTTPTPRRGSPSSVVARARSTSTTSSPCLTPGRRARSNGPRQRRVAFANDALNLLSVDASANRVKGDGDAATWLPPNKRFRCDYVARQVAVKTKLPGMGHPGRTRRDRARARHLPRPATARQRPGPSQGRPDARQARAGTRHRAPRSPRSHAPARAQPGRHTRTATPPAPPARRRSCAARPTTTPTPTSTATPTASPASPSQRPPQHARITALPGTMARRTSAAERTQRRPIWVARVGRRMQFCGAPRPRATRSRLAG